MYRKHSGDYTFVRTIEHAEFGAPQAVAVTPGAGGRVWVADFESNRVQVFSKAGAHLLTIGEDGQEGHPRDGNNEFYNPAAICVDSDPGGCVYVVDCFNNRVQVFSQAGAYVRTLGGNGRGDGNNQFNHPTGVAVEGGAAGRVFVSDLENGRVQVFTKAGVFLRTIGGRKPMFEHAVDFQGAYLEFLDIRPDDVAVVGDEQLYVVDGRRHRVFVYLTR